jgi:multiple sugar transport system ATP-binding protein
MAQIELDGIDKSFKANAVLQGISLSAEKGEIVVIFGPSGSGKTVLLRLVAGVEDADRGSIRLEGRDVTHAAPETRGVGMAFQNFALFPHMTAYDNVASALTARHAAGATIKDKVDKVAKLLKIGHVMQHQPRELSNGQKQRTALARALVADPHILLLDDPLRNVDAKLRYEMRLELPSLLKASGSTVLYVTQDYKEAMALGDRIAVLLDGRLVQVATPAAIYRAPATLGVARLFGDPTINLIPVEPRAGRDGVTVRLGGRDLALPAGYDAIAGRGTMLGLRPEAILVEDTARAGSFPVEVVAVTPLNEKTVLLLRTEDGREILASEAGTDEAPRRHGAAFARFEPAAALVFDAESGRRIEPEPRIAERKGVA